MAAVTSRENTLLRVVRISASRAGKSRTSLLGTCTAVCDEILKDFVAPKHLSYLQSEKQTQTALQINFHPNLEGFLSKLHLLSALK